MNHEHAYDRPVALFLEAIESMPWFLNLGRPIGDLPGAKQFFRWEDWPGPEAEGILQLSLWQQRLHDDLLGGSQASRDALKELWELVHEIVFRSATRTVPYQPHEDAWHGPTTAVWQAAWTAGLIAWCLFLQRPIPTELQEQWNWFRRGHWPAGFADHGTDEKAELLVF